MKFQVKNILMLSEDRSMKVLITSSTVRLFVFPVDDHIDGAAMG